MIGDNRWRMPPIEGDLAGEGELVEYLGSLGEALAAAFMALNKMNDPQEMMVPTSSGLRPLSVAMKETGWQSGDIKPSLASRSNVMRQQGWVPVNGKNGTPNSYGALAIGAAEATDAAVEILGSDNTGIPVPANTAGPVPGTTLGNDTSANVIQANTDACSADFFVAADGHVHSMDSHVHDMMGHVHDVAASVTSFSVIWMMKL
jgi:hypothetical protein